MPTLKCSCGELDVNPKLSYRSEEKAFVGACRSCAGPIRMEDRGADLHLWAWKKRDGEVIAFYEPQYTSLFEHEIVSCPIGWRLATDPDEGVVLRSTFGERLTPSSVYRLACDGERGFFVRS